MSKSSPSPTRRAVRAGLATGAALSAVTAAALSAPAYAAAIAVTTNPPAGPTGVATSITVSAATTWLNGVTAPFVTFSIPTCQTTYNTAAKTPVTGGSVTTTAGNVLSTNSRKVTNNMLAVTVPDTVVTKVANSGLQKWNVCVYQSNADAAAQIGAGSYSVGAAANISAISPTSGPSGGGSTITVTGSGFPTTVGTTGIKSVTLDGVPLTSVTSLSANAFTAVTPAHSAADNLTLAVTTPTGTVYVQDAYSYQFGVGAAPNTSPNESKFVDLDVTGSGFLNLTFGGAPDSSNAHIYLSQGPYDPTDATGDKRTPGVAQCTDVLRISDNEVICSLQMAALEADNTDFQHAASRSLGIGDATTVSPDLLTSTDPDFTFSADDIGMPVTQTGGIETVAATTIIDVISPTQVQLADDNVLNRDSTVAIAVGAPRAAVAAAAAAADATSLTALATDITSADIGRPLSQGGGIDYGTLITSVSAPASGNVTVGISRPTTGAVTAVTVNGRVQVPDGAYTLTVVNDGAIDANTDNSDYNKSIISSAATFTVSDY